MKKKVQLGQTLVTLIFFMVIATTVTAAAVLVITTNLLAGSRFQESTIAYQIAQSGADEAVLRFIRDSSYTGQGAFPVGNGTVEIQRSGDGPYTFLSIGKKGSYIKKVEVVVTYDNGIVNVESRREVFWYGANTRNNFIT